MIEGRLADKVAVVTGAARGIGRAVVAAFAAEGAIVHAFDRLGEEVDALATAQRQLGRRVSATTVDITNAEAVAKAVARAEFAEGHIDILVNNAGVIFFKPIEETSVEDWDRLMAVNLRGAFLCTRAVAAGMKRRRAGAIINVSSNAGVRGGIDESAYCASKFGIEGLSRALALEFKPYNVSVNTITPGHPVHTAMSEVTYTPDKRLIWKDPSEIAPAFVHLAMQDASGLNDTYVRAWDLVVELEAQGAAA